LGQVLCAQTGHLMLRVSPGGPLEGPLPRKDDTAVSVSLFPAVPSAHGYGASRLCFQAGDRNRTRKIRRIRGAQRFD